ncbi:unnamed protein product, partial [Nesidiocoris tenuis]
MHDQHRPIYGPKNARTAILITSTHNKKVPVRIHQRVNPDSEHHVASLLCHHVLRTA